MKVRINPRTDIPLHQIHKSKRDIEDRIDDEEWQQQMLELTECSYGNLGTKEIKRIN